MGAWGMLVKHKQGLQVPPEEEWSHVRAQFHIHRNII